MLSWFFWILLSTYSLLMHLEGMTDVTSELTLYKGTHASLASCQGMWLCWNQWVGYIRGQSWGGPMLAQNLTGWHQELLRQHPGLWSFIVSIAQVHSMDTCSMKEWVLALIIQNLFRNLSSSTEKLTTRTLQNEKTKKKESLFYSKWENVRLHWVPFKEMC